MLEGVARLPDDRREALIMRFALGMDNKEIAGAMGRTEGATKVLMHRAIRQLEGFLEEGERTMTDVERLLHYALAPVEPPRDMTARFERRLTELTDAALDEIAEFDPAVERSPRRWARVAAAGVVAGAAGGTLVLVRARQKHKRREARRPEGDRARTARGRRAGAAAAGPLARRLPFAARHARPERRRLLGARSSASAAEGVRIPASNPSSAIARCRKLSSVLIGIRPRIDSPSPTTKPEP